MENYKRCIDCGELADLTICSGYVYSAFCKHCGWGEDFDTPYPVEADRSQSGDTDTNTEPLDDLEIPF